MDTSEKKKAYAPSTEEIFGQPVSLEKGSRFMNMPCYFFEEAILVVARSDEPTTFIGKQPMGLLAFQESYSFLRDTAWGAYYLAREQVVRAVMGEKLNLYGIIWQDDAANLGCRNVFPIPPKKIDDTNIFDEDEDTRIQGIMFDELVIEAAQLEELFAFGPKMSELKYGATTSRSADGADLQGPLPKIGRPRKWDWERILSEVVLLANTPDGLPEKQSDLETWVCARCRELFNEEPALSQIRKKVAPIYQAIRSKGS